VHRHHESGGPSKNADANTTTLTRVADAFVRAAGNRLLSPSLKLDGTTFSREGDRLHAAFAPVVPALPTNLAW
jgi:hypothetical protein